MVACGVSLSNTAHASQSPQSNTPRAVAFRDVSLRQLAPRIHQFANCHRARPSSCSAIYIAGRLFNGFTANDRCHRICRSHQRSLSLSKWLMLAETVAQTDGQTLPIFIYRCVEISRRGRDRKTLSTVEMYYRVPTHS